MPHRTDNRTEHDPDRSSARARRTSHSNRSATRDGIITTAIDLFREKGYANSSMSEVARRVGIDPSSLYYYFPSKAAILAELFRPETPIPSFNDLSHLSSSRTEQLYALIVQDVAQKCELPLDFIEMESAVRNDPESFAEFYERYSAFYNTLVKVIERGVEEGEFRPCAADERAVTILSVNEGLQHHFHAKQRGELLLAVSGYTARNYTPEDIGHLSALSVIPGLINESINFDEAAKCGRRLYSLIVGEMMQR